MGHLFLDAALKLSDTTIELGDGVAQELWREIHLSDTTHNPTKSIHIPSLTR
jgi:hypothetical protein